MQSVSIFGGAVFVPTLRGLRLFRPGGANYSVGPDWYTNNTSPVNGRCGWVGASDRWAYLPVYNVEDDDTYLCAVRPRERGDWHSYDVSYFPIAKLTGKAGKICYGTGLKGSQARYTIWAGSDSDVAWLEEGKDQNFYDDSGYSYAASGILYGTRLRRDPDREKLVTRIEGDVIGATATETLEVDIVYTDFRGVEKTVRCGGKVTQNGHFILDKLPEIKARDFYPVLTFSRGSTATLSPRLKYGRLAVYGE